MPLMKWLSSYELGINEFDEHHKHLVYLLNMKCDGGTCGADSEELGSVLNELIDYATYHFNAEEHWMTVHGYPRLSDHCEEHKRFCERVIKVQDDLYKGKPNLGIEVFQFLSIWLTDHILNSDADYARFAKESAIL